MFSFEFMQNAYIAGTFYRHYLWDYGSLRSGAQHVVLVPHALRNWLFWGGVRNFYGMASLNGDVAVYHCELNFDW